MKRRGFLAWLGIGSTAAASGFAIAAATDESKGFVWSCVCPKMDCGAVLSQFIDLTGPVSVGTQCPRCLSMLDIGADLGQQIKQWNIKHGHKTTIYTPRDWK